MTFDEFRALTMPLSILLGAEFDQPTWRLYHRAVQNIPTPLYAVAIEQAAEGRTKFPSSHQLREFAEVIRQRLLMANPYSACASCELTPGWVTLTVDGVGRLTRCNCWHAWRESLGRLGLNGGPLAQPALPSGEMTRFDGDVA